MSSRPVGSFFIGDLRLGDPLDLVGDLDLPGDCIVLLNVDLLAGLEAVGVLRVGLDITFNVLFLVGLVAESLSLVGDDLTFENLFGEITVLLLSLGATNLLSILKF